MSVFTGDTFLRCLLNGNYNKCRSLLETDEILANFNLNKESTLEDLYILEQSNNSDLTLYECGKRIYTLIGNTERIAEKYFIVGLLSDKEPCLKILNEIYTNDGNTEGLYLLWKTYGEGVAVTEKSFNLFLNALSLGGARAVDLYLKNKQNLFYIPEYANIIKSVADSLDYYELYEKADKALSYINRLPEINELERMIIDANDSEDSVKIADYINSFTSHLTSIGYSPDEQKEISEQLTSVFSDSDTPLNRLYYIQKNKNGTVERLLWQSLSKKYDSGSCTRLMKILNEELRFEESIALYESFETTLSQNREARRFYMLALIETKSSKARGYICENVTDCLGICASGFMSDEKLLAAWTADVENPNSKPNILSITEYKLEYVVRCIISVSPELRNLVLDPERLISFGLNQAQIDNFALISKTDSYSRGRNILEVAKRLYAFLGNHKGIAEKTALLALQCGYSAVPLLWEIYVAENNSKEKFKLLSEYPEYREKNKEEYSKLLFENGLYEEFLAETSADGYQENAEIIIKTVIAKCSLNQDASDELDKLQLTAAHIPSELIIDLFESLAEINSISYAEDFILKNFEEMLLLYNAGELEKIITAGGNLTPEHLKTLQKRASENGCDILVSYLYETFKIGRFKLASEKLADKLLQEFIESEYSGKLPLAKKLKTIFANNSNVINKILLSEINDVLSYGNENYSEFIEYLIADITPSTKVVSSVMELLNADGINLTDSTNHAIVKMCQSVGLDSECIELLHKFEDKSNVLHLLYELYIKACKNGSFEADWLKEAEDVCIKLTQSKHFIEANYCMYCINSYYGKTHYANFNLLLLKEKINELPDEIVSEITALIAQVGFEDKTVFDLFTEMAESSSIEQIEDYCRFCGQFMGDVSNELAYYNTYISDKTVEVYNEEESCVILKLIYSSPENVEYWKKCVNMPLKENPSAYTKLLFKKAYFVNTDDEWKICFNACQRHSQDELLAKSLITAAKYPPEKFSHKELLITLGEKVKESPIYFSEFKDADLVELIEVFCKGSENSLSSGNIHTHICNLSIVTIATGSKKAFEILMNRFKDILYSEESSLCFAIACRLILNKRYDEAIDIIERLTLSTNSKFPHLINKLNKMSKDELVKWSAIDTNEQLLTMILPDGNYPKREKIENFTYANLSKDKAENTAEILCEILSDSENDYYCYMLLFILCKELPHRIDLLHMALCGLIKNEPQKNAKSFYERSSKDYAILLANINAVIKSCGLEEEINQFDGYDFSVSAMQYYQDNTHDIYTTQDLAYIDKAQTDIEKRYINQSKEFINAINDAVFAYVTGNWFYFLKERWNRGANVYLSFWNDIDKGFARSALRAIYSFEVAERNQFVLWLNETQKALDKSPLKNQIRVAVKIYNKNYYTAIPQNILDNNILELPFEEYSFFDILYENTVGQISVKEPQYTLPGAMLAALLSYNSRVRGTINESAKAALENSNDAVSFDIFSALYELIIVEKQLGGSAPKDKYDREQCEAFYRITGAFTGNDAIRSYIGSAKFNPWSCMNMVTALLVTPRANEVMRLIKYFAPQNQELARVMLVIVDNTKSSDEKLNTVNTLENEVSRGYALYFLRKNFLINHPLDDKVLKMIQDISVRHPNVFRHNHEPKHFITMCSNRIHSNVYNQLEADTFVETVKAEQIELTITDEFRFDFSFLQELSNESISDKTIDELWDEHENINTFEKNKEAMRFSLTSQMYLIALENKLSIEEINDYAVRCGIDYYLLSMSKKDFQKANSIILELADKYSANNEIVGFKELKKTVKSALHELLLRGFNTIDDMLKCYSLNQNAFIKMRNMLPLSTMNDEFEDVNRIYSALDILKICIDKNVATDTSAYKNALLTAKTKLNTTSIKGWTNVRGAVHQMIQDEINRLDHRPRLSVNIINTTYTEEDCCVYGEIKNIGNDIARNIRLQLYYNNGLVSKQYTLASLDRNDRVAFEIECEPDGGMGIEYEMTVSYDGKNETYTEPIHNILSVEEVAFEHVPTNLYSTDKPVSDFIVLDDEKKTVYSKNFFGREQEKRDINSIFNKDGFSSYNNMIIKGIRRAGKTSILNYLLTYARSHCDDAVSIIVDCSGICDNPPIQYTFIDSVIEKCSRLDIEGSASREEWESFAKKWSKLDEEEIDRSPSKLSSFYSDLKALNGNRGLILILDEFDILLQRLEVSHSVNNTLNSLRTLINDSDAQKSIRFVICGATKMITYMDNVASSQFFQQFGSNVIEIGKLNQKDMSDMLTIPYKDYMVNFTPEAIQKIFDFTSGLVWYSKLVANGALDRAFNFGRYTVYPSDVVESLVSVACQTNYFKSLLDSCNDEEEIPVLDVIQSITAKANEYVSTSKILEKLPPEFSQRQLESIIHSLVQKDFIERNSNNRDSCRFATELYWHYFRIRESNQNRVPEIPIKFKEAQSK